MCCILIGKKLYYSMENIKIYENISKDLNEIVDRDIVLPYNRITYMYISGVVYTYSLTIQFLRYT